MNALLTTIPFGLKEVKEVRCGVMSERELSFTRRTEPTDFCLCNFLDLARTLANDYMDDNELDDDALYVLFVWGHKEVKHGKGVRSVEIHIPLAEFTAEELADEFWNEFDEARAEGYEEGFEDGKDAGWADGSDEGHEEAENRIGAALGGEA